MTQPVLFTFFQIDPGFEPMDDKNFKIAKERVSAYLSTKDLRVGSWVLFPSGKMHRIAWINCEVERWDTADEDKIIPVSFQVVHPEGHASFYLDRGFSSYAGSLSSSYPISRLKPTRKKEKGCFWFFHHNWGQAHSAVGVYFDVPVWKYIEEAK